MVNISGFPNGAFPQAVIIEPLTNPSSKSLLDISFPFSENPMMDADAPFSRDDKGMAVSVFCIGNFIFSLVRKYPLRNCFCFGDIPEIISGI